VEPDFEGEDIQELDEEGLADDPGFSDADSGDEEVVTMETSVNTQEDDISLQGHRKESKSNKRPISKVIGSTSKLKTSSGVFIVEDKTKKGIII